MRETCRVDARPSTSPARVLERCFLYENATIQASGIAAGARGRLKGSRTYHNGQSHWRSIQPNPSLIHYLQNDGEHNDEARRHRLERNRLQSRCECAVYVRNLSPHNLLLQAWPYEDDVRVRLRTSSRC